MNGHFLLTGSDDGYVFVVDGRASKKFEPLGYVSKYFFCILCTFILLYNSLPTETLVNPNWMAF